ncbi:MAG: AmmeMemoRadiSam system radical SAM enzyme [Lachnospiraceae bacterium]|nr:AmmeMemoRadiSam system radical SAM enzyme [Lachnospiraceae bacterium]
MKCDVCPHGCAPAEGQTGYCRARARHGETTVPKNHGLITSLALDPIEKKPLSMFMPGSYILSLGSYGCNLRCPWCQNHEISQADSFTGASCIFPEEAVETALGLRSRGNVGIAYTYNEPLICWEYVAKTGALARENGLVNVLVTNGCFNEGVAEAVLPLTDAANIDLKVFSEEGYRRIGGDLTTVLSFIGKAVNLGVHVELTTLIVPGVNDDETMMEDEARYIASVDPEIPLHVTRFFPRYRMTGTGPTPVKTVIRMADIASGWLKNVFTGNI